MKLNTDIICKALQGRYPVRITGPCTEQLTLSRPKLYLDNETEFLSDHLYLAMADHLPLHPRLGKNVAIVAIGEDARLAHYREKCSLMVIRQEADFFAVNKEICRLFDRYDAWEKQLFDIFLDTAGLQEIVDCSARLFGCPIHVLDASFHYLTMSDAQAPSMSLSPEQISKYLSSFKMTTEKRGAILLDMGQTQYLCVNLFTETGNYNGCLYLDKEAGFDAGDCALAEFLAHILEKAIEKNPAILNNEQAVIKGALINLVNEYPLTANQKWRINLAKQGQRYVCICQHSANRLARLPRGYISSAFETEFPGSCAFPKKNAIICFTELSPLRDKQGDYHASLNQKLRKFLTDTGGIAGVSNSFADLSKARIACAQAEAAIENGRITNPDGDLYYFQSYALISMVINSTGSLPAEAYFSERLQKLIGHDQASAVSYLETLRVYLKNSLSCSQTAAELFIHRSTVVDRISRIERELQIDLKDPDTRLQMEIILKAMEIKEMVRRAREFE